MLLLPAARAALHVCCRTTAPPGVLELLVAQRWLTLCLRCTGKQMACPRQRPACSHSLFLAYVLSAIRCSRLFHPNHLMHNLTHTVAPACCVRVLLDPGADSRHKSLALWEKLLARQAAAVRAIRHRAAVANTPGATGACSATGLSASVCWRLGTV
jgi:hypothetical protein